MWLGDPHLSESDLEALPLGALQSWLGSHQHDVVALRRQQQDWEGNQGALRDRGVLCQSQPLHITSLPALISQAHVPKGIRYVLTAPFSQQRGLCQGSV